MCWREQELMTEIINLQEQEDLMEFLTQEQMDWHRTSFIVDDIEIPTTLNIPQKSYEIIAKEEMEKHVCWSGELSDTFIETGTFYGHGIVNALMHGAREIYSVEINPEFYKYTVFKMILWVQFASHQGGNYSVTAGEAKTSISLNDKIMINLYLGDSSDILPIILAECNKKATIWLDAHYGPDVNSKLTPDDPSDELFPVFKEIDSISKNNIKDHKIILDDMLQFTRVHPGRLSELQERLLKINNNYSFRTRPKSAHHAEGGAPDDYIFIAEIQK